MYESIFDTLDCIKTVSKVNQNKGSNSDVLKSVSKFSQARVSHTWMMLILLFQKGNVIVTDFNLK